MAEEEEEEEEQDQRTGDRKDVEQHEPDYSKDQRLTSLLDD